MAIEEKTQSTQDKQAVTLDLAKKSSDLAASIIKTYDLPTSIADAVDKEHDKGAEADDTDSQEAPQESNEESGSEGAEELSPESEDSEPKQESSVQKRIDELTREKRQLEARLKKLESASTNPSEAKDADLEKLSKMSVKELEETRKKILRAYRTADEQTLDSLFELEEKVNKSIADAPVRFQSNQLERFNEAVSTTDGLDQKELEVVFGHAKNIFSRTPSFQKSVDGQAEAWNLAVDHYKEMNKLTVGKSKVNELERKVNDLKKKTSLDTAVQKGNSKISDESKLFNKAKNGSTSDKEAFLKKRLNTDSFIPDEFRR